MGDTDIPERVWLYRDDVRDVIATGSPGPVVMRPVRSRSAAFAEYVRHDLAQPVYPAAVVQRLVEACRARVVVEHTDDLRIDNHFVHSRDGERLAGPFTGIHSAYLAYKWRHEQINAALADVERVGRGGE